MATIPNGIYRFTNQHFSSRALNVIGTNAASTVRNVCLYEDTLSDPMQKWSLQRYATATIDGSIYPTYRLHSIVNNVFVLDRSDGSIRTSYNNNAHLCKTTATSANDSELIFKELSDNTYLIRLRYYDLYLTATTDPGNSPSSAISTSEALSGGEGGKGNVYWAPLHYKDSKQRWILHDPNANPNPGTGNVLNYPSGTYDHTQQNYPWNNQYGISTDHFHRTGCSAMAATYAARIKFYDASITPEDLFECGVLGSEGGYPYAKWGTGYLNGSSITYSLQTACLAESDYCHMILSQLQAGNPVIAVVGDTNTTNYNFTHFVTVYGVDSGTTMSNITPSRIKVMDPWDRNNTTLKKVQDYIPYPNTNRTDWKYLRNIITIS